MRPLKPTPYAISTEGFTSVWRQWDDPDVEATACCLCVSQPGARPHWVVEAMERPSHVEESCQASIMMAITPSFGSCRRLCLFINLSSLKRKRGSSKTSWRWHWWSNSTEPQQWSHKVLVQQCRQHIKLFNFDLYPSHWDACLDACWLWLRYAAFEISTKTGKRILLITPTWKMKLHYKTHVHKNNTCPLRNRTQCTSNTQHFCLVPVYFIISHAWSSKWHYWKQQSEQYIWHYEAFLVALPKFEKRSITHHCLFLGIALLWRAAMWSRWALCGLKPNSVLGWLQLVHSFSAGSFKFIECSSPQALCTYVYIGGSGIKKNFFLFPLPLVYINTGLGALVWQPQPQPRFFSIFEYSKDNATPSQRRMASWGRDQSRTWKMIRCCHPQRISTMMESSLTGSEHSRGIEGHYENGRAWRNVRGNPITGQGHLLSKFATYVCRGIFLVIRVLYGESGASDLGTDLKFTFLGVFASRQA